MYDSNDIDLERQLWKNPLLVAKKILDAMAVGDCISEKSKTKKLFAGKRNGAWYLCDDDNMFNCAKAVKAVVPLEDSVSKSFMYTNKSIVNFAGLKFELLHYKSLDNENPRYAKLVLEKIFKCSASLEVVKSRWISREHVVKDCWSLQGVCCALGIDSWALVVENDLDASSC